MSNINTIINTEVTAEENGRYLNIVDVESIAPVGRQPGIAVKLDKLSGNKDGKEYKHLVLTGQLKALDDNGKPFVISKTYNLLGRGEAAFIADCNRITGKKLKRPDLRTFDKMEILNKPLDFEIGHRKEGSDYIAVVHEISAPDKKA